ncbi:MAG: dephospho-CoA kinase, partial [Desulfobulbaceae bacterium]|nr:dephospho-CoA kinase [Desulfobulbaceae bacterium]
LHPLARLQIREHIREQALRDPGGRIVVEVPLLYEAGWQDEYSRVIVVYAHAALCWRRLVARDGIGPEEAKQAMDIQMDLAEKVVLADHVIDNSGVWADTCLQMHHLSRVLWPAAVDVFL